MYLRISYTGAKLIPSLGDAYWNVSVKVLSKQEYSDKKIEVTLPSSSKDSQFIQENFASQGFAAGILEKKGIRTLIWRRTSPVEDGKQPSYSTVIKRGLKNVQISNKTIEYANSSSVFKKKELPFIQPVLRAARRFSKNPKKAASFFKKCIRKAKCDGFELPKRFRKSEEKTSLAIAELLRKLNIKALAASGFSVIGSDKSTVKRYWVRVSSKEKFFNVFPKTASSLKSSQLIFWSWVYPVSKKNGLALSKVSYSITPFDEGSAVSKDYESDAWRYFSLRNLPAPTQATYRAMLLIPLGALVMSFFRSFLGFPTFGTFMPVLFALSFLKIGLAWGLGLLSFIVIFGVIVRSFLNSLKLLLVPRLATTLSLVVLLVLLMSKVSFELGLTEGLSITLFPIIILTIVVERVSITWDELGPKETFSLFVTSTLASVLCYYVISPKIVQYWVFNFPEVTLIFIGLSIALGRYTGYRLVEYSRFKIFS